MKKSKIIILEILAVCVAFAILFFIDNPFTKIWYKISGSPRQQTEKYINKGLNVFQKEEKSDFISEYVNDLLEHPGFSESLSDKSPPTAASAKVNNYTFEVRQKASGGQCIDFFKSGKKIRSDCGEDKDLDYLFAIVTNPAPGTDINGDGLPKLIVLQYSGGAHCCSSYKIFSLGKDLKLIDTIFGEHSYFNFKDLDGDGKYEAIGRDWVFAYWAESFAGSPAPEVILRWKNGKYRLACDLMKKPPPLEKDLYENMPYIDREGATYSVVSNVMVELIYTGNGNLALKYCDWFWKNLYKDKPKPKQEILKERNEYLAAFKKQLRQSYYWPELKQMNGW